MQNSCSIIVRMDLLGLKSIYETDNVDALKSRDIQTVLKVKKISECPLPTKCLNYVYSTANHDIYLLDYLLSFGDIHHLMEMGFECLYEVSYTELEKLIVDNINNQYLELLLTELGPCYPGPDYMVLLENVYHKTKNEHLNRIIHNIYPLYDIVARYDSNWVSMTKKSTFTLELN